MPLAAPDGGINWHWQFGHVRCVCLELMRSIMQRDSLLFTQLNTDGLCQRSSQRNLQLVLSYDHWSVGDVLLNPDQRPLADSEAQGLTRNLIRCAAGNSKKLAVLAFRE